MDATKQKVLLEYLVSNIDLYLKCFHILEPSYFSKQLKPAVEFINSYTNEYGGLPPPDIIFAETEVYLETKKIVDKSEQLYTEKSIEKFCKDSALAAAVYKCSALVGTPRADEISKIIEAAQNVSLTVDLGLNYFENPKARLTRLKNAPPAISTTYPDLDYLIGKGLGKQEITYFAGLQGTGKSLWMANIAVRLVKRGFNVVYITLELSEDVVSSRLDSLFTGKDFSSLFDNIDEIHNILTSSKNRGNFQLKRMPETVTNANHIRAYLNQYIKSTGIDVDLLIVDYADIMSPIQKVSVENLFIKDKYISEELRRIAADFDIHVMTASQFNRGQGALADKADANSATIAGGTSKINTADNFLAIIQNDEMRSEGKYLIKALKVRNGPGTGKFAQFNYNPANFIITPINGDYTNKESFKRIVKEADCFVGEALHEIMDEESQIALDKETEKYYMTPAEAVRNAAKKRDLTSLIN